MTVGISNKHASKPPSNHVKIVEVGPRDGLQNEKTLVPTATKLELINRLAGTGITVIEAGAFVSPKWVPQMGDTPEILAYLDKHPPIPRRSASHKGTGNPIITYPYLVPNLQGLQRALSLSPNNLTEIAIFASASEGFSRKNINCTIRESLTRFLPVISLAKQHNIRVRGYISMVLTCPYDGPTNPTVVADVTRTLLDMGCYEISLGDTNGTGTPATVSQLLSTLLSHPYNIPAEKLACHFHDTYGMALVNSMAALYHGIRTFDSSVAGLGGCPYSKGATGNVATEDLVYFLHSIGFETGIDLEQMCEIGGWISTELGRANGSKVGKAVLARLEREKEREGKAAQAGEREEGSRL